MGTVGTLLTIKFNNIKLDTLPPCTDDLFLVLQSTLSVRFPLSQLPGNNKWKRNDRKDNANCSICPSPVGLMKLVG